MAIFNGYVKLPEGSNGNKLLFHETCMDGNIWQSPRDSIADSIHCEADGFNTEQGHAGPTVGTMLTGFNGLYGSRWVPDL